MNTLSQYSHLNNVVYSLYFDSITNYYLVSSRTPDSALGGALTRPLLSHDRSTTSAVRPLPRPPRSV